MNLKYYLIALGVVIAIVISIIVVGIAWLEYGISHL